MGVEEKKPKHKHNSKRKASKNDKLDAEAVAAKPSQSESSGEACNLVQDSEGTDMLCPQSYAPSKAKAGVCEITAEDCASLDDSLGDCDARNEELPSGPWPNRPWKVPVAGPPTTAGSTVVYTTGKWETNGAPPSLCQALQEEEKEQV